MSQESRGSPSVGMNGKKQKSRLENILVKLKKPDLEDESPSAHSSPQSPDQSSYHGIGDYAISKEQHSMSVVGKTGSESINTNYTNRRTSRKPTRRRKGTQIFDQNSGDVSDSNSLQHEGTPRESGKNKVIELNANCEEKRPPIEPIRIKIEKDDSQEWHFMPFSSHPFSEQQTEDSSSADTFPCDKCGDVFPSLHELDTHIDTHIKEETKDFSVYPCYICGKSFASEDYLTRHILAHGQNADSDQDENPCEDGTEIKTGAESHLKCERCCRMFPTDVAFQRHRCQKGLVKPYGCGRCGRCYAHLSSLKSHLSLHRRGLATDLECYECSQKFVSSIDLRKHVSIHIKSDSTPVSSVKPSATSTITSSTENDKKALSDGTEREKLSLKLKLPLSRIIPKKSRKRGYTPKAHSCQVCNKIFFKRSYLTMHMRVHGEKKYECSYCLKKFTFKKSMEIHVRSHTGEKPYHCSMCEKTFTRQDSLHKHEKMHLGVKPYVCETCGRQFGDRFELQRHSLSHSQEKPHKCSVCNKAYSDKKRLKEHMFQHSGNLPYVCELCGKGYARKYRYNQHLSQHAGEFKFRCDICDKGFYRRSVLNSHMETHSNKKPFSCDICGMGFLRESYLRRHMIVHSSDKPHHCSICGKDFARKNTLRRHLQIHKRKDVNMEEDFTEVNETYERYNRFTADFGYGISGSVAPLTASNAEERDIMKDIQAVIGLGDVNLFQRGQQYL